MLTTLCLGLLLLPGLALVRRYAPFVAQGGVMAQLGVGYLLSLAMLSPFSMAAYALHMPVAALGMALAALVGGGLVSIAGPRLRAQPEHAAPQAPQASLPAAAEMVAALCMLLLLIAQARLGGWLEGDATYHVGRVRDLLDHGLSNRDILMPLDQDPVREHRTYYNNLLHALYASVAWLTAQSPIDVWFDAEVWATLLSGAGHYLLGYVLTGRRLGGWVLCVFVLAARSSVTYGLYPNALSVGFLWPTLSALAWVASGIGGWPPTDGADVKVGTNDGGQAAKALVVRRALYGTVLAVWVIAQVHALYAAYALAMWLPLCAATMLVARLRSTRSGFRGALGTAAALMICLPFIWLAAGGKALQVDVPLDSDARMASPEERKQWGVREGRTAWQDRSPDGAKTAALRAGGGHLEKRLTRLEQGGQVMRVRHMGGLAWLLVGMASLGLLPWLDRTRCAGWLSVCVVAAGLAAMLLIAPLCTLAVSLSPSAFVIARLATWLSTLMACGVAGLSVYVAGRLAQRRPVALASVAPLLTVLAFQLPGQGPRDVEEHLAQIMAPAAQRKAVVRRAHLQARALRAHLPAGTTVLADLSLGRGLVMLHDLSVVAADRGMARASDAGIRRRDVGIMTAPRTPGAIRHALLERYGLRYLVYRDRDAKRYRWTKGMSQTHSGGLHIVELSLR